MEKANYCLCSEELLAEFRERADKPDFWLSLWEKTNLEKFLHKYTKGKLGVVHKKIFCKYLAYDSYIIEGGCGRGQLVYALKELGYKIIGVEFSFNLVKRIREIENDLKIIVGDVRTIPFKESSCGAFISFGVIEHYSSIEQKDILLEIKKVLKPQGLLFLSVPHFSPLFKRLAKKSFKIIPEKEASSSERFYQYYYSKKGIINRIEECGFTPLHFYYDGGVYGAKRSFPLFQKIYNSSKFFRFIVHILDRTIIPQPFLSYFAHMIFIVAKSV